MRLLVVRHGATEPNQRGVLLGRRADPPLTDAGRTQADRLAAAVAARHPTRVVTSPLVRARETADVIAARAGVDIEVDDALVEVDYGEWEGVPFADVRPDALLQWRRDPDFAPPGGESLAAVAGRVATWCEAQVGEGTVVAVTHVSPIKAAVAWALHAPPTVAWRLHVGVASLTTIATEPGRAWLVGFNDCSHLDGLADLVAGPGV